MLVEMKDIVVDFGPVRAVNHVNFTVRPGEIVGLLGENGAGKSTLMNALAGGLQPDEGAIYLDGEKVRMTNSLHAIKLGIRFIHQELSLCNDLRVFENMFLAEESTECLLLRKKDMARRAAEVFARMKVDIDPWELVENLSASEKQLVEIARALLFKSQLILMDEPTTALTTHEIENLFDIMRQLRQEGVSFVYISHKMPELFEICETYFVLRDGELVGCGKFADITESSVTEMMIGRQLAQDDFSQKPSYITEEVALEVKGLTGADFADISLTLHKGEVVAVTGLQSSGRDDFADALFGASRYTGGEVRVKGEKLRPGASILQHMKKGVAMVPRSRKERGILTDMSIYDNMSIGYLNTWDKRPIISMQAEKARYDRQQKALSIKVGSPKNPITSLSGGNQQKVILGRWLENEADILLFDNPTQGIDVGTKFEIYHLILELAKQGKAILVFSSEFPEIYRVADSCIVLYKGRVNAVLSRAELTEKNIMYYSTGANLEEKKHG